jgi:hypothetical protein
MSYKFMPTRTQQYVPGSHICIRLASFMGISSSMRILYKKILVEDTNAKIGEIIFSNRQLG